jgi:hypothetical protein
MDFKKVSVFVILETSYLYSKHSWKFFIQVWKDAVGIDVLENCLYKQWHTQDLGGGGGRQIGYLGAIAP